MTYSRLGDTGLIVSRLSFGSMTFGPNLVAATLTLLAGALEELEMASVTRQPYPQRYSRVIRSPVADGALGE